MSQRRTVKLAVATAAALAVAIGVQMPGAFAQEQEPKPDYLSGSVLTRFAAAYAAAGTEHFNLYNMLCPRIDNGSAGKIATPPNVNQRNIDEAEAVKVFDNLYYVGEGGVWESSASAWAVETSDGIILIDTLTSNAGRVVIERSMAELGLDPNDIKYIVISHNHPDHTGAARYLQDKYNVPVVMSKTEWDGVRVGPNAPRRDLAVELEDGDTLTLGDQTINFYVTPGHTPGTLSFTFPVFDGESKHVAAQWGGTGFGGVGSGAARRTGFETYYHSAMRFRGIAEANGADVLIANHPGLDNSYEKFGRLANRTPGQPHPFAIGQAKTLGYISTAAECAAAGAVSQPRPWLTTTLAAEPVDISSDGPTTIEVAVEPTTATGWVLLVGADEGQALAGGAITAGRATIVVPPGALPADLATLRLSYVGDELHSPASIAVPVATAFDVSTAATPRLLAGKVYLSATATNNDTVPLDVVISSPYGDKTFAAVAPGKTVSVSINSKLAAVPAGEVTVTVTGAVNGEPVTETKTAAYGAFPAAP